MMILTPLFKYRLLFTAELFIAEWLFTFRLKKRNLYWLRLASGFLSTLVFAAAMNFKSGNAFSIQAAFFLIFAFSVLTLKFCYEEGFFTLVFCAMAAYTSQHIAYESYKLVSIIFSLNKGQSGSGFYSHYIHGKLFYDPVSEMAYFSTYAVVYWLMFIFFADKIKRGERVEISNPSMFLLLALIVIADVSISAAVTFHAEENMDKVYVMLISLCNTICCLVVQLFQFELLRNKNLEYEMEFIRKLREKEKEHYALSKENIELINMKCHDMKHRIGAMSISDKEKTEIEKLINVYNSEVATGNDYLDVIIMEKSLVMNKIDALFSCIADGSGLNFLNEGDIYSLFGNILDNAIEAISLLEKEKRSVSLSVSTVNKFVRIVCKNYCGVAPTVGADGLPVTTKTDPRFHGYGVKSIKHVTEKYGGNLQFGYEDGVFRLIILIPIP